MTKRTLYAVSPIAAMLLLTGCIDDNYDLSDVDTSVEVKVNDLVIPVNLGTVKLNSIIDLENCESITKEPYTGTDPEMKGKDIYVYTYKGNFNSNPISINSFTVNPPSNIRDTQVHVALGNRASARRKSPAGKPVLEYDLGTSTSSIQYKIDNVNRSVIGVQSVTTPRISLATEFRFPDEVARNMEKITLKNVKIKFPEGLSMKIGTSADANIGEYDSKTGIVTIDEFTTTDDLIALVVDAQVIDMGENVKMNEGAFDFDSDIDVIGGEVEIEAKDEISRLPEDFDVNVGYDVSSFNIEDFTGDIDYDIEGLKFEKAELTDLPDFLTQDETMLKLANPQLYLSIYNSCAEYNLGGSTGLSITPIRNGEIEQSLDMESEIVVGSDKGDGPYKYTISPDGEKTVPIAEYSDSEKLQFKDLGNVLYGKGLPKELQVEFTKPHVYGDAKEFPLEIPGRPTDEWQVNSVHGDYTFRAPLALADGSRIVYSGTEEEWDSEELKDLYVNILEISADVTSTVPLDLKLSASLLNDQSVKMGKCEAATLPAMAKSHPIKLTVIPEEGFDYISGIDGIFYKAWAISNVPEGSDVPPLSPEQTLQLDNIRVKVSGKYLKLDNDDK